jgi:hypothetical protein
MKIRIIAAVLCALGVPSHAQVIQNVPGFWGHMTSAVTEYFLPPFSGQPNQLGTSATGSVIGNSNNDPVEERSHYLFDLSGVNFGPVVSATLDMKGGTWITVSEFRKPNSKLVYR